MANTVFGRAYRYRESKEKGNLENYVTELFAGALKLDRKFYLKFCKYLKIEEQNDVRIYTQKHYTSVGRPDIEIENGESEIILIECKIDSKEREGQLDDYTEILKSKRKSSKRLIYLTKYHEGKSINNKKIQFAEISWFDISELIDNDCTLFTNELKSFLIEYNIAMDSNFKTVDLLTLENITSTISKMNEVLDGIKDYFSIKFGKFSKDSSRSTRLKWGAYFHYKVLREFNIDIGFMWWNWGEVFLSIRLWIPISDSNSKTELINFLRSHLKDWKYEELSSGVIIGNYKSVAEFIINDKDHIPTMVDSLKETIDELYKLKNLNEDLFK